MFLGDDITLTLPAITGLNTSPLPPATYDLTIPPTAPAAPTAAPAATAQTATSPVPTVAQLSSVFPNLTVTQLTALQSLAAQNPTKSIYELASQFSSVFTAAPVAAAGAPVAKAPLPIWVIPAALGGLALLLLSVRS